MMLNTTMLIMKKSSFYAVNVVVVLRVTMGKLITPKFIWFLLILFTCTVCVFGFWHRTLNRFSSPEFYRDPQAIYEYFFADYQLSPVFRKQLLTELGLIANAFILKEKNGEDVATEAVITGTIAKRRLHSQEIQREIAQVRESLDYYHRLMKGTSHASAANAQDFRMAPSRGECLQFSEYIKQQSRLVADHDLPHSITTRTTQVIDISGNYFLKETPDIVMFGDSIAMASSERDWTQRLERLRGFQWVNGDIVFGHRDNSGGKCSIQGYWNHVGIYSASCDCLIDVWHDEGKSRAGGIRQSDFEFWAKSFDDIAVLRLESMSEEQRNTVIQFAREHLGEHYNLATYKLNSSGGWYCSKLVYHAFLQVGIDLDSGGGAVIFPDDMAVSQGIDALRCL